MNNLMNFIKGKTLFVSTLKDGKPTIRPFGAVMMFENKLYLNTTNQKDVYKQIIENPNICVCAVGENRQWVRIHGIAKIDDRIIAKQQMLNENPVLLERKRFSSANDPSMIIFYLENMKVEFH